uniref:ATP synthase complex subunit 8 n=1 Tax=Diplectrona hexapetala (nom. nud.) TaxID=2904920 RepID=A0A9E8RT29_9NEOP|nr:ATP synthase F0 subunit 8 [Diplectrona hexapetala (nom. nud.)]UZZ43860.1 ATP synthase F0 subunit 8 [Diplectrona hexapetala (nom. nud.)]
MPQMMPLNWLILFMMFFLIFSVILNILFYSLTNLTPQSTNSNLLIKSNLPLNWSW